jgi:hypothetical protein
LKRIYTIGNTVILQLMVKDTVADSPLDEWRFLIGTWKSSAKDQFGEKRAEDAVYLASSPEVEGKTDRFCKGKTFSDSNAHSHDQAVRQRLWAESAKLAGLMEG